MEYSLYAAPGANLPVLLDPNGKLVVKDNFIIGSRYYLDENLNETSPSNAKYIPDVNWKIYPKSMYPSAYDTFPNSYAFTNIEIDPNHYLFYIPSSDVRSLEYSRLLRAHFDPRGSLKGPTISQLQRKSTSAIQQNQRKIKKLTDDKMKLEQQLIKENQKIDRAKRYSQKNPGSEVSPEVFTNSRNIISKMQDIDKEIEAIKRQI